ncbi:MAG: glycosyl hydrolase family 18 protein [Candidatus Saccharibacteria bacterium]
MYKSLTKILFVLAMIIVFFNINPRNIVADPLVKVKINGELRGMTPDPQILNGRTMIPIRAIIEDPAVNGQALWEPTQKQVTLIHDNTTIVFKIGDKAALVNGVSKPLDAEPYILQGRTMIPLRFVSENLSADVQWDGASRTAVIKFDVIGSGGTDNSNNNNNNNENNNNGNNNNTSGNNGGNNPGGSSGSGDSTNNTGNNNNTDSSSGSGSSANNGGSDNSSGNTGNNSNPGNVDNNNGGTNNNTGNNGNNDTSSPGPASQRNMGYYYYGNPSDLDHSSVTDVAFRWLETNSNGDLYFEYWGDQAGAAKRAQALDRARQNGIRTHASVVMMGWDSAGQAALHKLLSTPASRQNLIRGLQTHAINNGYDGINIDLEGISSQDRDNYVTFLRELSNTVHKNNLEVSVAVQAKTKYNDAPGTDYYQIGQVVDLMVVMAYDYNFGTAGPSAPTDWFEQVTAYATSQVDPDKVLMGIGTYGYDWNLTKGTKSTFSQYTMNNQLASGILNTKMDPVSRTPYSDYKASNGDYHRVYFENAQSLGEKCGIIKSYGAGVAYWQMNGSFNDFYKVLGED